MEPMPNGIPTVFYLLVQYNRGWNRRIYITEELARKKMMSKPRYYYEGCTMQPIQGGDLYKISATGIELIEAIDGEYRDEKYRLPPPEKYVKPAPQVFATKTLDQLIFETSVLPP